MPEWLKTRYRRFCGDRDSGRAINVTVTSIVRVFSGAQPLQGVPLTLNWDDVAKTPEHAHAPQRLDHPLPCQTGS